MDRFSTCLRRVLALLLTTSVSAAACTPAEVAIEGEQRAEMSTEVTVEPIEVLDRGNQRGVALSPRSYEGTDLPDFLDIVDGSVDVLMHAGDWAELAGDTSAFRVLSELAAQRSIDTMIVLSPSNGTGLIRPLDDATFESYLASLRLFLQNHQPRYLGLGNELNLVASRSSDDFARTVDLFDAALPIVRELAPKTTVFVTLQYEWLLGRRGGWFGRTDDPSLNQWDLIDQFSAADALGITTYPGLVFDAPGEVPERYYEELAEHTDLPILITESGWSSNAELIAGPAGSELEQVEWAGTLLARAERLDAGVVTWTFLFSTLVAEPAFADMGLWRNDGTPRPGWEVWTKSPD